MNFTVREATKKDAPTIFRMIKEYFPKLDKGKGMPFNMTEEKLLADAFQKDSVIHFLVAEFKGIILGYGAYFFSYEIFHGPSLVLEEIYVSEDYRSIGISVFIFSKIMDIANSNNSYLLKWIQDTSDKKRVSIEEKVGVKIHYDDLILYAYKESINKHLPKLPQNSMFKVRFAKGIDLPDIFSLIEDFASSVGSNINVDIYKLMLDGFSIKPKFKIIIALDKDNVIGFMSFFESYSTFNGKTLIVNKTFITKAYRKKGVATSLLHKMLHHATTQKYERIETSINKHLVNQIAFLKGINIFPYEFLRMATFQKKEYKKLYQK